MRGSSSFGKMRAAVRRSTGGVRRLMKRSNYFLTALALINGLTGLLVPDYEAATPVLGALGYAATGFVMPVLIYSWCQADIIERRLAYPAGIPIIVGYVSILGLPLYFFKTRSLALAFLGLGKSAAFAVLCGCLLVGGTYAHGLLFA